MTLKKKIIKFNCDKVLQIGGVEIDKIKQKDILLKLGFEVENKEDKISLSVPKWRHDINEEVDIVEELLRVNGYDKLIEFKLDNVLEVKKPVLDINEYRSRLISKALVKRGLYEVVTFSFLSEKSSKLFFLTLPFAVANTICRFFQSLSSSGKGIIELID